MSKKLICPECRYELDLEKFKEKNIPFDGKCPACGSFINGKKITDDEIIRVGSSKTKEQLGILVLDGSGSMITPTQELITKEAAVSRSVTEFFLRMKGSKKKSNFSFAVVYFDKDAFRRLGVTEAKSIDARADYKPIRKPGQETYLYTGLQEAERIADGFLNAGEKSVRSVIIVIMTDGIDMNMSKAQETANQIKEKYGDKVKITASSFGTRDLPQSSRNEIMDFLKSIVTEESMCIETASAEELRDFFMASVSR